MGIFRLYANSVGAIQPFPPPLFLCFPLFAFLECREEFFLLLCVVRAKARRKGVRNSPTTFRTLQCSFTAYNITFGQIRPKTSPEIPIKKTSLLQVLSSPRGKKGESERKALLACLDSIFEKRRRESGVRFQKKPIFWSVRLTVRSSSKPPCRHPPPTPPQKRRVFGIQPVPLLFFWWGGGLFRPHPLTTFSSPLLGKEVYVSTKTVQESN